MLTGDENIVELQFLSSIASTIRVKFLWSERP
jgi:hypothetical protein